MGSELLVKLGQIASIAGISLGIIFLIFRQIIAKKIFPKLSPEHAYRILRLIIILLFIIGIVGMLLWSVNKIIDRSANNKKAENSIEETSQLKTEPGSDTITGQFTTKKKETRIDTVINIVTKTGNKLAFDLIISNTSDRPTNINNARLINTFKVDKAGFDPFLKTEQYDIWIDTIVPFRVNDDKTIGDFNLSAFENKDSLGYRGTGSFWSEESEKKSTYKVELRFPLLLQVKALSRNRIRLFFSGSRAQLKDSRKERDATMVSTRGKPQISLKVELTSTEGALISYSIRNDQLLKAVLQNIN